MIRLVLCLLASVPLTVSAQPSDLLLGGVSPASVLAASDGDEEDESECLGSEEDQAACYVVAGIATAAFGAAAIVGLVREGDPCAYLSWGGGTCGECNELNGAEDRQAAPDRPRRGVGVSPVSR